MSRLNELLFLCFIWAFSFSSVATIFSPKDRILISCGETKEIQLDDGRLFQPDFGNSNVSLSSSSESVVSNNDLNVPIIYNSARLFNKTSKYTIRTKQIGRHWLRLHLYPVKDDRYNLKSAVFSVVANGITLLHGFSFSKSINRSPILKEYVVEIGGSSSENLVVTLSPWSGSIAFINGMEVVSVPDGQFDFGVLPLPRGIGRHWLRLHLYPVKDDRYNLKSAVFSVVANGITLLHGFSFSKSINRSPILKEYVVEIGGSSSENLVVTLSPWSGSIAFINGMEVVSVPDGQFDFGVLPLPRGSEFMIPTHVALETVHRINMGGPLLTPANDTLGRTWKPDGPFLLNAASARNVSKDPRLIEYPAGASVEIAPNWVYATAQEMADANVTDQKFNITWVFGVEQGFGYFIRMHFCDIVSIALETLVFNVYINNQSAIDSFDISSETMALSAAYFIDFVLNVSMGLDQIIIQVGPANQRTFPANAILNGLEIMKMSSPTDSLDENFAGSPIDSKVPKSKRHVMLIAFACLGGLIVLLLILSAILLCSPPQKKPKQYSLAWLSFQLGNSDTKISAGSFASTTPSLGLGRVLAFSEIRESTKDFNESLVIGVGGFGKVYKGVLDNGVMVAVKRGNPKSQQGLIEFRTEIEMLSKLRHRHLVSLIGYCEELNEMILVYEFMAGGPLRKHLYGSDLPPLSWKRRLEICIGAAKGLHYLHTGAAEIIIHRDVKTTNILLDENFTAKVADFGLSKFGPTVDQTHVSTAVKGSFGYLDPEYYRRQQLTEKSDVYSFGVVLLEVLCARPAINPALPREQVNIAEWAMHWQKKGQLQRIIDPHLIGSISTDSLRKFGETAEKCLAEYGNERPTMGDVLWNLEYALQLQEASTQSILDDNSANHIPEIPGWIPRVESVDSDDIDIVSYQESDATTSTGVFSQLINPKGR